MSPTIKTDPIAVGRNFFFMVRYKHTWLHIICRHSVCGHMDCVDGEIFICQILVAIDLSETESADVCVSGRALN